jgi:hypothetical protein
MSQFYSSEQILIEVSKMLNLVFRYFDYQSILEAIPNRDIVRLNNFLFSCGKDSKTVLLVEWSFYTLTSMYIRILNSIN